MSTSAQLRHWRKTADCLMQSNAIEVGESSALHWSNSKHVSFTQPFRRECCLDRYIEVLVAT